MTVHALGAQFDERRNTSRVFAPSPDALPNALAACAAFRRSYPEHARWISEGAPGLTDAEHVRRFGERHPSGRGRTRATEPTQARLPD